MSTSIVFNGVGYSIPAEGDIYGDSLSAYLVALSTGALQKTGGTFTLTSETNFGSSYGLKLAYIKSQSLNPASSGVIRLGNSESISFRNSANNADISLNLSSDKLRFNSIELADISSSQSLTNKSISGLSNTLSNIQYSSLALSSSITNTDIAPNASIALSKLAGLALAKVLQTNASTGLIEASSVSNTELGYVAGVTSSIQTQITTNASNAASALSTHAGVSSGVHGVSGSVVGTSDSQTLTNKDIDGGTASNSRRITVPKDTKTNLDALTRKEGTLVFDTVGKSLLFDNGTILKQVLENNETPVVSRAIDSSGQSIPSGAITIVNFNSVTYDTPSAITTGASWKYTHTGATAYFDVSACLNMVSASGGGSLIIYLYKNGVQYSTNYTLASATAPYAVNLTDSIQLANTDFIDIRVLHNAGANRSLSANNSFITIKKIK